MANLALFLVSLALLFDLLRARLSLSGAAAGTLYFALLGLLGAALAFAAPASADARDETALARRTARSSGS